MTRSLLVLARRLQLGVACLLLMASPVARAETPRVARVELVERVQAAPVVRRVVPAFRSARRVWVSLAPKTCSPRTYRRFIEHRALLR